MGKVFRINSYYALTFVEHNNIVLYSISHTHTKHKMLIDLKCHRIFIFISPREENGLAFGGVCF